MKLALDFVDPAARYLHQRSYQRHIICDRKELSIGIEEIFRVNLMNKLRSIWSQMAKFHPCWPEKIVFLFMLTILWRVTIHQSAWLLIPKEIRVKDSWFFSLVSPVKQLKDISSNQLIIPIDRKSYRVFATLQ